MAFKVVFIVRAPNGDPNVDFSSIKTPSIEVTTIVVEISNTEQLIEICKNKVHNEGIHAIVLCPAVSNETVARVTQSIEGKAALFVGRGDFQSVFMAGEITNNEWFKNS